MSDAHAAARRSAARTLLGYLLMLAVAAALFLIVRHLGEPLRPLAAQHESAPAASPEHAAAAQTSSHATPAGAQRAGSHKAGSVLFHVLLALAAMIVVGQALALVLDYFGQPPVIGEVIAGIVLGPSLLGQVAPQASAVLFPPEAIAILGVLGQLGVILYMFVVGLEFDSSRLAGRGHTVLAISHASIVLPFVLAAWLALWIYPALAPADVRFTPFALFLGVAMSITAFPVLARILTDRQMDRTRLGVMALACAATDDATAWCLLAFVVGVAQAQPGAAALVVALTAAYIALMVLVVRPLILRFAPGQLAGEVSSPRLAAVLVALLASALATEVIGVHAIFGAFLLGAIVPHDSQAAHELGRRLKPLATALLLPAFFAFSGLRTQLNLVAGTSDWLTCAAIIGVATLGKFGGTLVAARWTGLGWREGSQLGILMNTRGLMELIVLNIGLDFGVISPPLFAMMVIMALVTTLATAPLLSWLAHREGAAAFD